MTITTVTANISANSSEEGCPIELRSFYPSIFGIQLAVPDWEAISTTIILSLIIIFTIIGNVLVILSVFTYKPLRIVQNFFIVSLAVADLTVAILVLPFNVAYSILGKWEFGIGLCKMWLTCDVLCCTSSILNLCAIALDRYWAITDPINYAQKRTVERVLLLIAGVWILSLLISSPPLIGWNDWPVEFTSDTPCQLTSQKGYVIYSALGSFYIPLFIMAIVYIEIFIATRRRLRERAQASKMNAIALRGKGDNIDPLLKQNNQLNSKIIHNNDRPNNNTTVHEDQDSISSETNHNEHPNVSDNVATQKQVDKQKKRQAKYNKQQQQQQHRIKIPIDHEDSITDNNLHENSSDSLTMKQNSGNHDDSLDNDDNLLNNSDKIEKLDNANTKILIDNNKLDDKRLLKQPQHHNNNNNNQNQNRKFKKKKRSIKRTGGVYQFIEEKQKISLSKERRAARTLGIIMGVFVICWLPFFLMYVILPFCSTCCPTDKFINFITWLGYINSALNPIIYTIFNLEYRRAFKRLLGIKF